MFFARGWMVSMRSDHDVTIHDDEPLYDYPGLHEPEPVLKRSNIIIHSMYRASMISTKLLLITMHRCQQQGTRFVRFSMSELKALLCLPDNSYVYEQIKIAAFYMIDHKLYVEDAKRRQWGFYTFLESAIYTKGMLYITLSPFAYQHITELQSDYTAMDMPYLLSFGVANTAGRQRLARHNYSLRLYELLRTKLAYVGPAHPSYIFKISLISLQMLIGVINPDDKWIRDIIQKNPADLEAAIESKVSANKNRPYARWSDFEKRVLRYAQEEMKKTDVMMSYTPIRSGLGGKVTAVIFEVSRNPAPITAGKASVAPDAALADQVYEMVGGRLRTRSILRLLSAAGNDLERIRLAWTAANDSDVPVKSLSSFMLREIRRQESCPL